jgi:glycerophosphoryl diester phosphodiesterase
MTSPFIIASTSPLVIGHRGACGYAPENTILSFEKAIDLGVDIIELDVQLCKSGELIVIHDATIDRNTNGQGLVKNLTLDEIKKFSTSENQTIPTLSETIEFVNKRSILNIELKGPSTAEPVANLIEYYVKNKNYNYSDFIVSSFNHNEVYAFHKLIPEVKTGAILEGLLIDLASFAERAEANYAVVYHETLNQEFVNDAHKKGIKVLVYTVNDPRDIQNILDLQVDGIISNYPDRISR